MFCVGQFIVAPPGSPSFYITVYASSDEHIPNTGYVDHHLGSEGVGSLKKRSNERSESLGDTNLAQRGGEIALNWTGTAVDTVGSSMKSKHPLDLVSVPSSQ